MSWKGFQRGVVRAPQTLKEKLNIGEFTKDATYADYERQLNDLEKQAKLLHGEATKYYNSFNLLLNNEIGFAQACANVYKPLTGRLTPNEETSVESRVGLENSEGLEACQEYERISEDLMQSIRGELELIQTAVVQPVDEFLSVVKLIRKTTIKRDHKKLDYDRHRGTLKRLQEKKNRALKDEKGINKAEIDVEQARQEFDHYNELLKSELPALFVLAQKFIEPILQSLYSIQLDIYRKFYEKLHVLNGMSYFDIETDIKARFTSRHVLPVAKVQTLKIVQPKLSSANDAKLTGNLSSSANSSTAAGGSVSENLTMASESGEGSFPPPPPYSMSSEGGDGKGKREKSDDFEGELAEGSYSGSIGVTSLPYGKVKPPPPPPIPNMMSGPLGTGGGSGVTAMTMAAGSSGLVSSSKAPAKQQTLSPQISGTSFGSKSKTAPPPPKPKPARLSVSTAASGSINNSPKRTNTNESFSASTPIVETTVAAAPYPSSNGQISIAVADTVTALYDYEAQAEGDLSFHVNDVIEVIHRTDNTNEWWTGRLRGRQGQFPGNYVRLNH